MSKLTTAICGLLAMFCAACVAQPGTQSAASATTDTTRERVERGLGEIERGLSLRTWDRVQKFFSRDYYGGISELRNSIEDNWRNERQVQLQFLVNRLNEQDGLINAQVRWNKSYVDNAGSPHKKNGLAEFVLKPEGSSFQILKVGGDRPF